MFQPATTEIAIEGAQPERETVIKFVISGPFLNAEAAHAQRSPEPAPDSGIEDLMRRIADLERKLDEERELVESLARQMPATPAPKPKPEPEPELELVAPPAGDPPPAEPGLPRAVAAVAEPALPRAVAAVAEPPLPRAVAAVAEPALPRAVAAVAEPVLPRGVAAVAEPEPTAIAALAPLSTLTRTPPPKVRGLRRMIGALRRL